MTKAIISMIWKKKGEVALPLKIVFPMSSQEERG